MEKAQFSLSALIAFVTVVALGCEIAKWWGVDFLLILLRPLIPLVAMIIFVWIVGAEITFTKIIASYYLGRRRNE